MAFQAHSHTGTSVAAGEIDVAAGAAFDSLGTGLFIVSRDGVIRYRNALATTWFDDVATLQAAFDGARFVTTVGGWQQELQNVIDNHVELRCECMLSGTYAEAPETLSVRCARLTTGGAGNVHFALVVLEPVSGEDRDDWERLEVARRLATLGKLAVRVAHELNNPLDGILRYINLALRAVEKTPHPKVKGYLAESRTGLMRMAQIIGELLEFTRNSDVELEQAGVHEIVEQAIRSQAAIAKAHRVVIAADFQTQGLPTLQGGRLYQVCCNLLRNAIDAMPKGGRVEITVRAVGEEVVLRVADTGKGLPDPPEKIFEPFFTTKRHDKGTGIGLAICKDFVEGMGGTIDARNGEEGAVFTVRLPMDQMVDPRLNLRRDRAMIRDPWT